MGFHRFHVHGIWGSYRWDPVFSVTHILPCKEFIRLHFCYIREAGCCVVTLQLFGGNSSSVLHLCWSHIEESHVSPLSVFLWCNMSGQKLWVTLTISCSGKRKTKICSCSVFLNRDKYIYLSYNFRLDLRPLSPPSLYPSPSHLQLYMIMALMAALLMRLRCFLLRRGKAGRNGTRRTEAEVGATVERAGRNREKE